MADDDVQYETKSVRTIRGLEARTKAKWQKDGWEFVAQSQSSLLQTEMTFRRVKAKRPWYLWGTAAAVLLAAVIALTIGAVAEGNGGGGSPDHTAAAASTPKATTTHKTASTPASKPTQQATPSLKPVRVLDETTAAQFLALRWEAKFVYGGTVHWIEDRITTPNPDGTFTFKIGATVKNQYGTDMNATIEGDVGGTDDAPTITDSILYTDDGDTVNFDG